MKPEQFTQAIKSQSRVVFMLDYIGSSEFYKFEKRIKELKKLTKHMDFDCQFNNNGCKRFRDRVSKNPPKNPLVLMCCCFGCASYIGYLRIIHQEDFDTIANLFSEEAGFWEEGKGCILPQEFRSALCVTYNCSEKLELWSFYSILKEYEDILIREFGQLINPIRERLR